MNKIIGAVCAFFMINMYCMDTDFLARIPIFKIKKNQKLEDSSHIPLPPFDSQIFNKRENEEGDIQASSLINDKAKKARNSLLGLEDAFKNENKIDDSEEKALQFSFKGSLFLKLFKSPSIVVPQITKTLNFKKARFRSLSPRRKGK